MACRAGAQQRFSRCCRVRRSGRSAIAQFSFSISAALKNPFFALQGVRVTHQESCYGDGTLGGRATEMFTLLQSGAPGQDCDGFFLLQ